MFVERFDALMNIAELSNSQLGREISMNPSRIGRLRSGARPLPKHHEFLPGMCAYLAAHLPCGNDPGKNRTAGQNCPIPVIDKTPGYLAPLTGRIRYPGVLFLSLRAPHGGQLSFLPADVLAKEGVCHTKPAPVGR